MKKTMSRRLVTVIALSTLLMVLLSYYFQIRSAQDQAAASATLRIQQIEQILSSNDQEIQHLKQDLQDDHFIRAKAAAYILGKDPGISHDLDELRKIAELLQVDEIHLFDTQGTLYSGTEPKYYGYTFYSGEQMQFFLPMLHDTQLQLCQDVQPNTAEAKLMQYVAVWREDRSGIIQIGIAPVRLLEAMKKTELPHIFTMVTANEGDVLFAADRTTGRILGATAPSLTDRYISDLGLSAPQPEEGPLKQDITVDGQKELCVIKAAGDVLIGVSTPYPRIYQNIAANMLLIVLSLMVLSGAMLVLLLRMLDHYVIRGIHQITNGMGQIAAGDLDHRVAVTSLPEFSELSRNINQMVASLLETTGKLSLVFQNVDVPIAVYEYNLDMGRVLATSKTGQILGIPPNELSAVLADRALFRARLAQICREERRQEGEIYLLDGDVARFIQVRSYQEGSRTLGILVDVTAEMQEKQQIRYERDVDVLTGLLSRRAFFREMDRLFRDPGSLGHMVMLMIDVDDLKRMNDSWGHDRGDELLARVAGILRGCPWPHTVTARLSGDEFVMFLYALPGPDALPPLLDAMHRDMTCATISLPDGTAAPVQFSCGYALFSPGQYDHHAVLKQADEAMYHAKKQGKGRYLPYRPSDPDPDQPWGDGPG